MTAAFVFLAVQQPLDQRWVSLKHVPVFIQLLEELLLCEVEHCFLFVCLIFQKVELLASLNVPLSQQTDENEVAPDLFACWSEAVHLLEN